MFKKTQKTGPEKPEELITDGRQEEGEKKNRKNLAKRRDVKTCRNHRGNAGVSRI